MATMVSRPVRARIDDYFFAGMSLVILASVFLGFAHTYFLAGALHTTLPQPNYPHPARRLFILDRASPGAGTFAGDCWPR